MKENSAKLIMTEKKLLYKNGGYFDVFSEFGIRKEIGKKEYANGDYDEGGWKRDQRNGKG